MIYPWQQALWQDLQSQRQRLPHALLLSGVSGIGKLDLARAFAHSLLCLSPHADGHACGQCRACHWLAAGSHPDYREVTPDNDGSGDADKDDDADKTSRKRQLLTVDAIRRLIDFLSLSAHQHEGWKVVLLAPAEAMNGAAANALLKTLEEPPARVLLLLVSHQVNRLLPTIRSRCRLLQSPLPDATAALNWLSAEGVNPAADLLALSGGAPLAARQEADPQWQSWREQWLTPLLQPLQLDVLGHAERTERSKAPIAALLSWLSKWLYDLLSCKLTHELRYFPGHADAMQRLLPQLDVDKALLLEQRWRDDTALVEHPVSPRLLIEGWLLGYRAVFNNRPVSG